ncbi:hypothetical protein Taro_044628 [Colocasia esculenta]|uniref:Uncharacterized protein n=1 Tax=Colocasia esculenta TaxID=4460 RepID=A0A843X319_COLES|nr:hypothetical protein [Colocasia esculenta]
MSPRLVGSECRVPRIVELLEDSIRVDGVWVSQYLLSLDWGVLRRLSAVEWTPYAGEYDTDQPWVELGRPYIGREIWLHAFNTVVPLHLRLVMRTLGLHQVTVSSRPCRGSDRAAASIDFNKSQTGGSEPRSSSRTDGTFDPEGRVATLEGLLHSTVQQQDELQQAVTELRVELELAQQMLGGSSFHDRFDCSILEGQLVATVTRAEEATT